MSQHPALPHAGFTLFEVILVVAVASIVMVLTVPTLNIFLDTRRQINEDIVLRDIRNALTAFATQYNRLPDENPALNGFCNAGGNSWAECLASVSNLSVSTLETDTWGQERAYIHGTVNETLLGRTFTVHYATVHSAGANRRAEETAPGGGLINGMAVENDNFEPVSDNQWWANETTPANIQAEFEGLIAGGDDHLLKFSDLLLKSNRVQQTQARIDGVMSALQSYASLKENEETVACNSLPVASRNACFNNLENEIFFPPAQETTDPTPDASYNIRVRNELTSQYASRLTSNRIGSQNGSLGQIQARLDGMIALVRLLGLPDEFCCDALVRDTTLDANLVQERPLFYYSNPRERVSGTCQPRQMTVPFVPAYVSWQQNPCE